MAASSVNIISIQQLQHLVRLLDHSDVSELELRRIEEGTRLVLRKVRETENNDQQSAPSVAVTPVAPLPETKHPVVAPLVGIFHSGNKPKSKALVAVGERVKAGQLVATIESLNVINDVESPMAGRVTEILVQEGQPIEYGQVLMTIDSAEGS